MTASSFDMSSYDNMTSNRLPYKQDLGALVARLDLLSSNLLANVTPITSTNNSTTNPMEPTPLDVEGIMKADMISSAQYSHPDDMATLLLALCDADQDKADEMSISSDIFEPIPLQQISAPTQSAFHNESQPFQHFHPTAATSQGPIVSPTSEVPRAIDLDSSAMRTVPALQTCSSTEEDGYSDSGSSSHKDLDYCPKFRCYQTEQWTVRYDELCDFYSKHGHSSVPHTDKSNKCLARWVKRQRYQYKRRQEGKPSAMTDDRIVALERLGFVWDSHGAAWEDRLKELEEFKAKHRHCNVPSNYRANSSLASWIKCQRRQYRMFLEGKKSNMTEARIEQLERMGFRFNIRVGGQMPVRGW